MNLFTMTNTFAAKLFATKLRKMSCLFSHSLLNIYAQFLNTIVLRNVEEAVKIGGLGISYSNPIPVLIPVCEIANSGVERE